LKYNKPQDSFCESSIFRIALTQLYGFGTIRTKRLLSSVSDVADIFTLPFSDLAHLSGFSVERLQNMNRQKAIENAKKIAESVDIHGINMLFYSDPNYPRRLKQCEDAPLLLYFRGNLELNNSRFVAVVGTRNASDYGKQLCGELIPYLASKNITVVSGMAYGIDIYVHKLCLKHEIPTIGVMAHGLDFIYPHIHRSVAHQMLDMGGLLSEYPPGTQPDRENFPRRNRIVAGLCDATVVVETKQKGGSLITAELANDYNRDVFAFPGRVFDENMKGCNQLIANNKAHLVHNGIDFLDKMTWNNSPSQLSIQPSLFPELNPQEQVIVNMLKTNGMMNVDNLASQLQLSASELSVLLFGLEMSGVIASIPGNRCQLA